MEDPVANTGTVVGWIGLALLLVSALGLTIAAIFTTDPITVSKGAATTEGSLHNLGGTLGIAMPFAAALVGWTLSRNPAWSSAKRPLFWATGLALVAYVGSFVSVGVMVSESGGKFGPDVLVGWPNRIEIMAYSVWLMVVSWQAIRVRDTWGPGSGRKGIVRPPAKGLGLQPSTDVRWRGNVTHAGGHDGRTLIGPAHHNRRASLAQTRQVRRIDLDILLYSALALDLCAGAPAPRAAGRLGHGRGARHGDGHHRRPGRARHHKPLQRCNPLDGALWDAMAFFVVLAWAANLLTAVLLLVQRMPDPAFAWSLRLGVLISFVGMSVAFLMTTETPEQAQAAEAAGIDAPIQGTHSVGVEDGRPGLPLTGWSTTGGDLRVPHFIGPHGLQALPLIGFLLTGFGPSWLRQGHRKALVWTIALSYLGLVALLTWQALRGQPLIRPDAATLGALLALAFVAGTAASAVMLHARRTIQEEKSS